MIELTEQPIDVARVIQAVCRPTAGAVVLFLGVVREDGQTAKTVALEYECYQQMAEKELRKLQSEAASRWPGTSCAIVHRVGKVPLGEATVAIAVAAPHRKEAYSASQWLIDELKSRVPIWKQEHLSDGSSRWLGKPPGNETR